MIARLPTLKSSLAGEKMLKDVENAVKGAKNKDLLIYVHIPFCSSKCAFCDWVADIPVSQLTGAAGLSDRYVEALCKQIRSYGPHLTKIGYTPKFIYWGGGTPSKLDAEQVARIIEALRESFDLSALEQHAMETSPETLTQEKLNRLRALGVERLSMGVQSFIDKELRHAGRSHSAAQAVEAARMIKRAGFDNFNLDLIAALPGQTMESFEQSVRQVIELETPHVSVYVYRPDPRTVMAQQSVAGFRERVHREKMMETYLRAKEMFEAAGYHEYATFYFAKERKHYFSGEMYYFELQGDYVGFGAGAYSIMGHRFLKNQSELHAFIENPVDFEYCEVFTPARPDKQLSFLMSAAVLTEMGINYERFARIAGFPFAAIRRHPYMEVLMQYYVDCGSTFQETREGLKVQPETRSTAHINHLAGIYEAKLLHYSNARAQAERV
nr:Radical SAM domain protein [uncultured bacterium]